MLFIFFKRLQTIMFCSAVLFAVCSSYAAELKTLELLRLRTAGDMHHVQVIALFNENPDYKIILLANPARLIINLRAAKFTVQQEKIRLHGFLEDVRYSMMSDGYSRMIFNATSGFKLEHITAELVQNQIWQLVIDLVSVSEMEFQRVIQKQQSQRDSAKKRGDKIQKNQLKNRLFTVVIDAGHGDFDSGAIGVSGILEKEVTLAFAKVLRDLLQREPNIHALLTRDNDMFLRLNERIMIARHYEADLFISIHADHINVDSLRGVTVYTLSEKSSDTLEELAEYENKKAALLKDFSSISDFSEITDILIDLAMRETQAFSIDLATRIIDSLKKGNVHLIKNPHRYAGFRVLQNPDIPSILIELGYLSNAEDEKKISDPQWQKKIAVLIAESIRGHADMHMWKKTSFLDCDGLYMCIAR
ncbi:MAG: N-acetylmuramoyl-L-alanine amidase [Candidatus Tokpelaia sp. JSC085]|nr:MAG: N-acetylmuramoyl-L-alanine amidase [Candidatus Tokpelaia sp. JSC085]